MENKQRNRTVRRYHRSMKTGEVLPCVAVEEVDCRAEHLTPRQAYKAFEKRAAEETERQRLKEVKKAESRERRRAAQTAYMRKWRARKAAEAREQETDVSPSSQQSSYMDLVGTMPASWFAPLVPDDEREGLLTRVDELSGQFGEELRSHILTSGHHEYFKWLSLGELLTLHSETEDLEPSDETGTVVVLGEEMDIDRHFAFTSDLTDTLFAREDEILAAGIDRAVARHASVLSEELMATLNSLDCHEGLDARYAAWQSKSPDRAQVTPFEFIYYHLSDWLDEEEEAEAREQETAV